jgi:dipeptidyl aminopeptidase/acylaminoacyl peptidase
MLQGTADDVVPVEMQERFVACYGAAGGQVELVRFQGMPHTFVQRQPEHPESKRAIETMIRFIERQANRVCARPRTVAAGSTGRGEHEDPL